MATTTTEQKKRKDAVDKAKEEISRLFRLKEAGSITEDQYYLQRLPYLEIIGTRQMYDDTGRFKK